MLNKYHFVGKLILSNKNLNEMNYGIISPTAHDILYNSISDILNEIYQSNSPFVSVQIRQTNCLHSLNRSGKLNIRPDRYGVNGFHIDDFPLELELDEKTNQEIEIHIEHLEEKEIKYKKVSEEAS